MYAFSSVKVFHGGLLLCLPRRFSYSFFFSAWMIRVFISFPSLALQTKEQSSEKTEGLDRRILPSASPRLFRCRGLGVSPFLRSRKFPPPLSGLLAWEDFPYAENADSFLFSLGGGGDLLA